MFFLYVLQRYDFLCKNTFCISVVYHFQFAIVLFVFVCVAI